jgi:hypothetical protein
MSCSKISKNIFGLFLLTFLSIFANLESAAQCGGTYFKRHSTTLVPMSVNLSDSVDMTGDGIPDLVGLNVHQGDLYTEVFIILPGNGSGGFGAPITFQVPDNNKIFTYITGDFDNDNFKDVLLHYFSPSIRDQVFRNNGDGTFTGKPIQSFMSGRALHLIDINNDGKGDLIWAGTGVRYHLGNGDGSFQSGVLLANGSFALPGDFNTDGKVDFIVGGNLLLNQGGAVFTTVSDAITFGANEGPFDVRDYTGDGKPDVLLFTRSTNGKISLLVNTGSNSFQRTDYPLVIDQQNYNSTSTGWFYAGNFSGSASPDALVTMWDLNKTIVFTNDGAGNLSQQQVFNYSFRGFPGDFDSDGKLDTAVISGTNQAQSRPHKLFNELTATVQKNVCNPVGQTRLVDFDHSGTTDFSYWTPADGKWSYLSSTNLTAPSVSFNWGAASFGDIPAPGDFDGDGTTDYAVYRNSTGVWWIYRSSDQQPSAVQFGLPGDKPVVGDYDGDTISDVAVWRPSDGNWYVLFMGTQSYTIAHWGQDGDKPVPEDYDGDGKTDLAVFRPSTGEWFYLKSSDLNFGTLQFGLGTDRPVPADYDGDGKADIAVYRDSNNVLHMLRSSNFAYFSYLYGSSQAIPQPGDYDGDFVTDIVVYRPSTQSWNVFYQASAINFGASGVVPTASMLKIE